MSRVETSMVFCLVRHNALTSKLASIVCLLFIVYYTIASIAVCLSFVASWLQLQLVYNLFFVPR